MLGALVAAPFTAGVSAAVAAAAVGAGALGLGTIGAAAGDEDATDWKSKYGVPDDFVKQVGGVIQPGNSAVFAVIRSMDPQAVAEKFRGLWWNRPQDDTFIGSGGQGATHDSGAAAGHSVNPDLAWARAADMKMAPLWWTLPIALASGSAEAQSLFDRPAVYAYAPDTGQVQFIKQAVERGVHGMLPTPRRIARRRLLETNTLPGVLRVMITPDSIGTQQDSGKAMTLLRNGMTVRWDDGNGDVCQARETVVADTLTQFCDAGSGGSAYQYVLEDEARRLRMVVHITSSHLGGHVDYAIEFHVDSAP